MMVDGLIRAILGGLVRSISFTGNLRFGLLSKFWQTLSFG